VRPFIRLSGGFRYNLPPVPFHHLRSYGFSDGVVERIKSMYKEAASSIQITGHVDGPIPIHSSVRQGCPMSMLLFALCVDPLLRILDQKLPGIRIGKRARKTVVVVYADVVTTPTDVPVISDAIQCYEKTTGVRLNTRKSKALAVEGWSTSTDTLNIQYHAEIKILGVNFASTIEHSMNESWANVTGKVRAKARDTYERDLSLSQRIRYVQAYFLAKIWHTVQVFPTPMTCTRQLTTAIAWYIWKGATFRIPKSTLQKPKRQGG